ncbi:MAG: hypothetical protein ACXWWR_01865, partial [Candidatus Limnocylindrales bacterium]
MRRIGAGRSLALVAGASLLMSVLLPIAAAAAAIDVSFAPPRLILRGEVVTLEVAVPDEQGPTGVAYVRSGSTRRFTRLPMAWSPDGRLIAKVPARLVTGSVLEEYVVVRVPRTSRSVTVPSAGAAAPYRSWILDQPSTSKLARHQFGRLRSPDAIVALADPGNGPAEAGFACPAEGRCAEPTSFDVEADGTVWVADPVNHRLLIWEAGHPSRPSRSIPLDFVPLELVVAPDHMVLVSGVKAGVFVGIRLFAIDHDGRQRWWSELASEVFNTHLRFGSDGVLYSVVDPSGPWTPVMDRDGAPLGVADQVANVRPDQPLSGGRLVVDAQRALPPGQLAPRDWRAAIATTGGKLRQAWRITSSNDLGLSLEAVPTTVGGDPMLVFDVYRFADHTMEHVVVRLSATGGIRDRFSLGRGGYPGGDVITDVRVGADGRLYQLLSDPVWGLKIARYAVKGPASPSVTPTSSPNPTP